MPTTSLGRAIVGWSKNIALSHENSVRLTPTPRPSDSTQMADKARRFSQPSERFAHVPRRLFMPAAIANRLPTIPEMRDWDLG